MAGEPCDGSVGAPQQDELLALVRAFQAGRADSFEPLHARLWGPVRVRAGRMGLRPEDAEEIAQKVLVRVYLHAGRAQFGESREVWAWVHTITVREVYKLWRARRPEMPAGDALASWSAAAPDVVPGPPAAAAEAEAFSHVQQCIAALEECDRQAFLGVLVGGLTFRYAAKAHGLTLGQFKHRYERALEAVRRCMRGKGHDVS